jgi:glucan phosphoethanolaminetransferase (alkaline phosphatase superfamily)
MNISVKLEKSLNNFMVVIKNLVWGFPLVGGLIIIISFLTPAATFTYQESSFYSEFYRWMLDFYIAYDYMDGILTTTRFGLSTSITGHISYIISFLIIGLTIFLLISVIRYKKRGLLPKINWLGFSILIMILTIAWMVMKEVSTILSYNHSFWGLLSPGFGIIGLFSGAGLEIIGYISFKKSQRNE